MANEQHRRWLQDGVEAWNAQRKQNAFQPDLSKAALDGKKLEGVDLSSADLSEATLRHANLKDADLRGADLTNADLTGANLSHATLTPGNLRPADLSHAIPISNLRPAILTDAILIGANLAQADLTDAILTNAKLINANLAQAILTRARLDHVDLSKSILFSYGTSSVQPHPIPSPPKIESVPGFIQYINKIYDDAGESVLYFRGETQSNWPLRPTITRTQKDKQKGKEKGKCLLENESAMLRDLISDRPNDFSNMTSSLDKWMLAQHHGLQTRFLDVTKNPLVALFYACEKPTIGRLRVFAVPKSLIKAYDSDAIRIVANFANLSRMDQIALLGVDSVEAGLTFERAKERLLQLIRLEKPYFPDWVDVRDFYRIFVVEPQQTIERIRVQSGAFLVSAFHRRYEAPYAQHEIPNLPIYDEHDLQVPQASKEQILKELRLLGITRETLFPGLDESARAITKRYS